MSSEIVSFLHILALSNYLTSATIAAVVYDYTLTFSREIDYVWCQPWTWVSSMFVVVRYIGLCWIIASALFGSSLVPGPLEYFDFFAYTISESRHLKGKAVYLLHVWGFVAFLSATDLLMILRVYAMWNRSRTILSILLLIYILQTTVTIVLDGIYVNPNSSSLVETTQVLDFSLCTIPFGGVSQLPSVAYVALRMVLSAILTILVVSKALRQSFDMYRATKLWQPNRYMQTLAKEGVLYFIVNLLFHVIDLLSLARFSSNIIFIFLDVFIYIAFSTLIPRFVISIRELYARDIRGRFHVDTGFGVASRSGTGTVSAMAFADVNQRSEVEDGVGIALESAE